MRQHPDSFGSRASLEVAGQSYEIFRLDALHDRFDVEALPYSIRVLLENVLRHEDGKAVTREHVEAVAGYDATNVGEREIGFVPARVLLQDFTGVPCIVDLASMREAFAALGGDPQRINPLAPVDLVIDHSVQVDSFGTLRSFDENVRLELERNAERYRFLKWGQGAFDNLRVVPPGTGICHQVNLEYLARVVFTSERTDGSKALYPDTLVGTDSHTTMANGLGLLGWGVGGIEAEAAMLGQPVAMLLPEVVGFELSGSLRAGVTATDVVLTVTELLRRAGVVGKFVEFFGPGLSSLSLADRATLANMAPEYGATMGFFPVDDETLSYLRLTGRSEGHVALVEQYCKAQHLFWTKDARVPRFSRTVSLDLGSVVTSLAGPARPQDRVPLTDMRDAWRAHAEAQKLDLSRRVPATLVREGTTHELSLGHGDVVIAAITSCTNTSNPSVLVAAGLLAEKAVLRGLTTKPWVKTSLAPGSQVVTDYLQAAGLLAALEALGFHLVGYGCTTCIGNSGPLEAPISQAIAAGELTVAAVLSGNRNFEGRISSDVRANYLASPPLVVAYALAGTVDLDLEKTPLGHDREGQPVFLRDVWPSPAEIAAAVSTHVTRERFVAKYADVFRGPDAWRAVEAPEGSLFAWDAASTYIAKAPFFEGLAREVPPPPIDLVGARCLALLGDSITTDHISPAGGIAAKSPAGRYLTSRGVGARDFNQYGARRGHHEVMVRGTFANPRIRNAVAPGTEGGVTRFFGEGGADGPVLPIADAAEQYRAGGVPLVVIAGKEYGTGSSRDWAAKGTLLQGVRAVIAESFERIHRSNLVGMGVLPLQFVGGASAKSLGLTGLETFEIRGITSGLSPGKVLEVIARGASGEIRFHTRCRIDSPAELDYVLHGGILPYVLRQMATA